MFTKITICTKYKLISETIFISENAPYIKIYNPNDWGVGRTHAIETMTRWSITHTSIKISRGSTIDTDKLFIQYNNT